MTQVIRLFRDTVAETIEEISTLAPDTLVAFTMKNGQYYVHASDVQSVTMLIGALERVKFALMNGS